MHVLTTARWRTVLVLDLFEQIERREPLIGEVLGRLACCFYAGAWALLTAQQQARVKERIFFRLQKNLTPLDARYMTDILDVIKADGWCAVYEARYQVYTTELQNARAWVDSYRVFGDLLSTNLVLAANTAIHIARDWYRESSRRLFSLARKYNVLAHRFETLEPSCWQAGYFYELKSGVLLELSYLYPQEIIVEPDPDRQSWLIVSRPPHGSLHIPLEHYNADDRWLALQQR